MMMNVFFLVLFAGTKIERHGSGNFYTAKPLTVSIAEGEGQARTYIDGLREVGVPIEIGREVQLASGIIHAVEHSFCFLGQENMRDCLIFTIQTGEGGYRILLDVDNVGTVDGDKARSEIGADLWKKQRENPQQLNNSLTSLINAYKTVAKDVNRNGAPSVSKSTPPSQPPMSPPPVATPQSETSRRMHDYFAAQGTLKTVVISGQEYFVVPVSGLGSKWIKCLFPEKSMVGTKFSEVLEKANDPARFQSALENCGELLNVSLEIYSRTEKNTYTLIFKNPLRRSPETVKVLYDNDRNWRLLVPKDGSEAECARGIISLLTYNDTDKIYKSTGVVLEDAVTVEAATDFKKLVGRKWSTFFPSQTSEMLDFLNGEYIEKVSILGKNYFIILMNGSGSGWIKRLFFVSPPKKSESWKVLEQANNINSFQSVLQNFAKSLGVNLEIYSETEKTTYILVYNNQWERFSETVQVLRDRDERWRLLVPKKGKADEHARGILAYLTAKDQRERQRSVLSTDLNEFLSESVSPNAVKKFEELFGPLEQYGLKVPR